MAYKKYSDSTLLSLPKKELLEHLRCAEHNRDVAEQALEQQAENFKNLMHQPMSEWVSVKDRLPEENKLVLGFTGTAYRLALHEGNNRWRLDYYEFARLVSNVFTHWMPLPKPPKTDEEVGNA